MTLSPVVFQRQTWSRPPVTISMHLHGTRLPGRPSRCESRHRTDSDMQDKHPWKLTWARGAVHTLTVQTPPRGNKDTSPWSLQAHAPDTHSAVGPCKHRLTVHAKPGEKQIWVKAAPGADVGPPVWTQLAGYNVGSSVIVEPSAQNQRGPARALMQGPTGSLWEPMHTSRLK